MAAAQAEVNSQVEESKFKAFQELGLQPQMINGRCELLYGFDAGRVVPETLLME